jgi:hypothetical protein
MTRILLLCGVAGALLSGGCATVPQTEARLDTFDKCDADFVARVEREAKRHGSAIRWYRCPQFVPTQPQPQFYFGEWRDA